VGVYVTSIGRLASKFAEILAPFLLDIVREVTLGAEEHDAAFRD
jgi:hypothetical protein